MHMSVHDCLRLVLQPMLHVCMQQTFELTLGDDSSFGQLGYVEPIPPLAKSVRPSLSAHTLSFLHLAPQRLGSLLACLQDITRVLTDALLGLPDVSLPVEAETAALSAFAAPTHTHIVWSLRSQLLRSVALLTNQPAQLSDFRECAYDLCSSWFEQIVAAAFKTGPLVDFVGSPAAYYSMHGKDCLCCCALIFRLLRLSKLGSRHVVICLICSC